LLLLLLPLTVASDAPRLGEADQGRVFAIAAGPPAVCLLGVGVLRAGILWRRAPVVLV